MFDIPNYNILVTSRTALPGFSFTYYLNPLNDDHATMLLHHSASLQHESSNIPVEAINKIVRGCGGFPLALEVIGRLLDENPVEAWCSIAKNWSNSHYIFNSNSNLLDCLRKSLELSDHEVIFKECFIDLGSFPEDQRIPVSALIDMWPLSSSLGTNYCNVLKDASEINKYYNEDYVTQHDLLRELAIFESCQGPERQRQRLIMDISRNTLPSWCTEQAQQPINARLLLISIDESFSSTWCNIQAPKVEVLVLNFQTNNYSLPAFVDKMDNLKVLIITNYGFFPTELRNFQLLKSLPNLKTIRLEKASIPSLCKAPILLKSLKKISLFMCNIAQAFGNCTIQVLDALPNLMEINIDYCNDLVESLQEKCLLATKNFREMASGDDGTERWCVVIGGRGFAARHLVEKLISYNMFLVRIADMGPTINLDPHEENGTLGQALRSAQAVQSARRGMGTKNGVDACIELKVKRLIYTSSPGVHGILDADESVPYLAKCRAVQTYSMTRPTRDTTGTDPKPADPTYSSGRRQIFFTRNPAVPCLIFSQLGQAITTEKMLECYLRRYSHKICFSNNKYDGLREPYTLANNLLRQYLNFCEGILPSLVLFFCSELPAVLCDVILLKILIITNCHQLSTLSKEIGKLVNLEVLRFRSCIDLSELPESITSLKKSKSITDLKSLRLLDIFDCLSIRHLPKEIGELRKLEEIHMKGCLSLRNELPPSTTNLEQLKLVICDEERAKLWEPIKEVLTNLEVKVAEKDINLTWLLKP
ncbi:probable disease resistance protein At5g66900 [Quercus robur]|uniref:probable disease resistance protein At5g66900 n=1 Tax=Quercus robur TaxID=38942 RepID=UPI00216176B6|nr:probable disease resistance protein At5g66900 [Quercus robur]